MRRVLCECASEILFLQLPDNVYASNSKCLLRFTNFAAPMQYDIESTAG